jgi:hypothetical protein
MNQKKNKKTPAFAGIFYSFSLTNSFNSPVIGLYTRGLPE